MKADCDIFYSRFKILIFLGRKDLKNFFFHIVYTSPWILLEKKINL